jgi:3-methyladenine DNA glycosylase AlkD
MTALGQAMREKLRAVAAPERAERMRAYMKSDMPYLGVSAVPLQKMCREMFGGLRYESAAAWTADVLGLWRGAAFREERYAALALTGLRAAIGFQTIAAMGMYEEMVVTGAWWDYVDVIATNRLWEVLCAEPVAMKAMMRRWSVDENIWKRRCSIIFQNKSKRMTDVALLYACIEPSIESKEFFLRKAIGWALREYAWSDPDEVRRYVGENGRRLSGLSKREALRNVGG